MVLIRTAPLMWETARVPAYQPDSRRLGGKCVATPGQLPGPEES
ncbi:hypothetical protein MGAST_09710 [Mycobacterium gastri 'Wayne']|nr:hypothetical protein MGAST_09710 [Mycobacterium gastri 'Wayne']